MEMEWWIAVSELVRNFGLLAAALFGLILGGMRVVAANRQANAALRQAELARRDHVAELFNRAVGQLDDPQSSQIAPSGSDLHAPTDRPDFPD